MRKPYTDRHVIMHAVVDWMRKNTGVRGAAKMPGMPSRATIWRWGRDVPDFARQMAEARVEGRVLVQQARAADHTAYVDWLAQEVLSEVKLGRRIEDLVRRPQGPTLTRLRAWSRRRPEFRAALAEAKRMGRRMRPLPWPFDEAVGDRILLRLNKGETLPQIVADPGMPGLRALRRWRRAEPNFGGAMRRAMRVGSRTRAREASMCTPELTARVAERIELGESLHSVAKRPGMPSHGAMYGWMKSRRAFAAAVQKACGEREWILREQALMRLDGEPDAEIDRFLGSIGAVRRRVSTMPRWPGDGRR